MCFILGLLNRCANGGQAAVTLTVQPLVLLIVQITIMSKQSG